MQGKSFTSGGKNGRPKGQMELKGAVIDSKTRNQIPAQHLKGNLEYLSKSFLIRFYPG